VEQQKHSGSGEKVHATLHGNNIRCLFNESLILMVRDLSSSCVVQEHAQPRQWPRQSDLSDRFVIALACTGAAQNFSVAVYFSAEVDAFATLLTRDALALVSRKFFRREIYLHPLG